MGVAIADEETRFARPLEVIDARTSPAVDRVRALVDEHGATLVVIGRPVHLSGDVGAAAEEAQAFADAVSAAVDVPVKLWDERLTTVVAEQGLRAGGAKATERRAIRDAVAAQVMLQGYLDASREGTDV